MKCPVCKNELQINSKSCSTCGFSRLNVEFFNVEGATNWVENVVLPYRKAWQEKTKKDSYDSYSYSTHTKNTSADISDFEYKIDEHGVVLTKYLKYGFKESVCIPETILGKNVYYLGDELFKDCKEIKSIYLPATVQIIGVNVFNNTGITEIKLPPYLKAIGNYSFSNTRIQEIFIPNCVSYIGEEAFSNTDITSIVIPERVKKIPKGIFSGCHNLKSVNICGAEELSVYAFSNCKQIEDLLLPETLKTISREEDKRYYSCFKLSGSSVLVLPQSLESIDISDSMPARTIVAKNDSMKWIGGTGFTGLDFDLSDTFTSIFGHQFGNQSPNGYTIYCNPGSTSHEFARKRKYNVKPLTDII